MLPGEVVAIDGKTVRRSHDKRAGRKAIHLVSAWASANTLTLGQVMTGEKSNEITAIPRLLEMLELKGCIVTIDAMGCQKEIAQGILDREADYLLAVKENQGRLYGDIRDLFEGAEEAGFDGVHDYAGAWADRTAGVLGDQGPGCPEHGERVPGLRSVVTALKRATQPRQVLHQQPRSTAGQSLSGREPALRTRCTGACIPGGPEPDAQRPQPPEHGHAEADSPQPAETGNQPESGHPRQAPASRLERRLPAKSPPQLKRDCPAMWVGLLTTGHRSSEHSVFNLFQQVITVGQSTPALRLSGGRLSL